MRETQCKPVTRMTCQPAHESKYPEEPLLACSNVSVKAQRNS